MHLAIVEHERSTRVEAVQEIPTYLVGHNRARPFRKRPRHRLPRAEVASQTGETAGSRPMAKSARVLAVVSWQRNVLAVVDAERVQLTTSLESLAPPRDSLQRAVQRYLEVGEL